MASIGEETSSHPVKSLCKHGQQSRRMRYIQCLLWNTIKVNAHTQASLTTLTMQQPAVLGTRDGSAQGRIHPWPPFSVESRSGGEGAAWKHVSPAEEERISASDFCCSPSSATFYLSLHCLYGLVNTLSLCYLELWIILDSFFSPLKGN